MFYGVDYVGVGEDVVLDGYVGCGDVFGLVEVFGVGVCGRLVFCVDYVELVVVVVVFFDELVYCFGCAHVLVE